MYLIVDISGCEPLNRHYQWVVQDYRPRLLSMLQDRLIGFTEDILEVDRYKYNLEINYLARIEAGEGNLHDCYGWQCLTRIIAYFNNPDNTLENYDIDDFMNHDYRVEYMYSDHTKGAMEENGKLIFADSISSYDIHIYVFTIRFDEEIILNEY